MATELTTKTAIDILTAPTISEPEWLKRCLSVLKADYSKPMLPENYALTDQNRRFIESEINRLEAARKNVNLDQSATIVTKLLLAFPSANTSKEAAEARAEGFITAFEDLPTWAIAGACRSWLRGQVKGQTNLGFAPSPPQLRKAALEQMGPIFGRLYDLKLLLRAEIEIEYSFEYRKNMLMRLKEVFSFAEAHK